MKVISIYILLSISRILISHGMVIINWTKLTPRVFEYRGSTNTNANNDTNTNTHAIGNCDDNGNPIADIELNNDTKYTTPATANANATKSRFSATISRSISIMMMKGVASLLLGLLLTILWIVALVYFSRRIRYR